MRALTPFPCLVLALAAAQPAIAARWVETNKMSIFTPAPEAP